MNLKNRLAALAACVSLSAGVAHAVQEVDFTNVSVNGTPVSITSPIFIKAGDVFKFSASLTQNTATGQSQGLGLCFQYVAAILGTPVSSPTASTIDPPSTVAAFENVFPTNVAGEGDPTAVQPCAAGGAAPVPGATTSVIKGWAAVSGGWPGIALPVKLYDATFTIATTPTTPTLIGFGASSVQTGETFASNGPLTLCGKPTVTLSAPVDGSETGPTNASLTVNLSAAIPAACGTAGVFPVTLNLGGSASVGSDYTVVTGGAVASSGSTVTINFPANGTTTSQVVSFAVIDDNLAEGNETIALTVGAGSGNYEGVNNTLSANIADNDASISVAVTQDASEPSTNGIFTFTRTGVTTGALNVNFALTGTATTAVDYTVSAGTGASAATPISITFNPGATTAILNVNVIDDVLVEGTETVVLTVGAGFGYSVTGANPATMNINDNDSPPSVAVTAVTNAAEPTTNGSFTITRTVNTASSVPLNFTVGGTATRGTDYTLSTTGCVAPTLLGGSTLTIAPSVTTVTVSICVIDDAATEGNETVIFTIASPTAASDYTVGSPSSQTANIADDDGPLTVTIAATTQAAEPSTNGLFTLTRSGGGAAQLAAPLTVNVSVSGTATNGADYSTIGTTVTFAGGSATATIPVTVIDDNVLEGDETVIVAIASGTGYAAGTPSSATVTIADNEIGVSVTKISDAAEGSSAGVFRICRTGSTAAALTVGFTLSGTAVLGTDFTISGNSGNTVTIAAGQTCTDLLVTVVNDSIINGTRDVIITLVASGSAQLVPGQGSAQMGLIDDERPRIIPTMSSWGLMLMALMLAGIAGFTVRRRV